MLVYSPAFGEEVHKEILCTWWPNTKHLSTVIKLSVRPSFHSNFFLKDIFKNRNIAFLHYSISVSVTVNNTKIK